MLSYCDKYVSIKIDCEMNAQQNSYLSSIHHVMSHVTHDMLSYCGKYVSVKIDCKMNAQQSSYLSNVHHVMSHVIHDNCLFNKKAVFSVQTYNQSSHVIVKKRKRKEIRKK